MDPNPKRAEIDKKIVKISVVSIPGPLLLGFGLLGKYGEPDEIPFAFLNDGNVVNAMLVVGAAIMIGIGFLMFKLALEKGRV